MTTKYHPLLVVLHWLMAILLIGAIFAGHAFLEDIPNDDPEKIDALAAHMAIGFTLLALVIIRLIVRFTTKKPPKARTGNKWMDRGAGVVHFLLYFFIIGQIFTGIGMAMNPEFYPEGGNLVEIVFKGSGQPLPESFEGNPLRDGHGMYQLLLIILITVHFGAAIYHHFILKDGLLRRMWFGKREE